MIWLQLQDYGFAVCTTFKNCILEIFALKSELSKTKRAKAGFKAWQYLLRMIFATVSLGLNWGQW